MTIEEELKATLEAASLTVYYPSLPAKPVYPNVTFQIIEKKQWRRENGELVSQRLCFRVSVHSKSYLECNIVMGEIAAVLKLIKRADELESYGVRKGIY